MMFYNSDPNEFLNQAGQPLQPDPGSHAAFMLLWRLVKLLPRIVNLGHRRHPVAFYCWCVCPLCLAAAKWLAWHWSVPLTCLIFCAAIAAAGYGIHRATHRMTPLLVVISYAVALVFILWNGVELRSALLFVCICLLVLAGLESWHKNRLRAME